MALQSLSNDAQQLLNSNGVECKKNYVQGLYRDWEAVENALLFASSQGQTEGQVNRLKAFKRQGYGRASPALLQARLVGARDLYLN